MKKTSFFKSLPFKLLIAVFLGIIAGLILNQYSTNGISMAVLNIVVTVKYILGQIITFCVPLIILGFIAPSITKLGKNASVMLGVAVVLAYGSSVSTEPQRWMLAKRGIPKFTRSFLRGFALDAHRRATGRVAAEDMVPTAVR